MISRPGNTAFRVGGVAGIAGCSLTAMGMGDSVVAAPGNSIVFVHVPVAANSLLAALVVFVASVGYLGWRQLWWDRLARAAAFVTVLNASILLISGSIWAKSSWGVWWLWSPRLTFSLLLWLLYALYLLLRTVIRGQERCRAVCATYGTIAFLDVPLVYLSVNLIPDVHPQSSSFGPGTTALMWVSMLGVTAFSSGLIAFGMARGRRPPAPRGGNTPTSTA